MQRIDADSLIHFPQPLKLKWHKRTLHFKRPAVTSRGALEERSTYIIEANGLELGECCVMPGLLPEPTPAELDYWCAEAERIQGLPPAPSPIRFGMECAMLAALHPGHPRWNTPFSQGKTGIRIHHLIWMDNASNMMKAMQAGIAQGFSCLKLKVGALSFQDELALISEAHSAFPDAEIRVDANGAFSSAEALPKLEALAGAGVSFIEQPIRHGNMEQMAEICRHSPLPVALDEELINTAPEKILPFIKPQGIVIKPSLHGGLLAAQKWAQMAEELNIEWWVNSALESHIGLTALAEWCAYAAPDKLHGLGKGSLFANDECLNIELRNARLWYKLIENVNNSRTSCVNKYNHEQNYHT